MKITNNFFSGHNGQITGIILLVLFLASFLSCNNNGSTSENQDEPRDKNYGNGTTSVVNVDSLYVNNVDFQYFIENINRQVLENIPDWDSKLDYKNFENRDLRIRMYKGVDDSKYKPALVFFHGGSWKNRALNQHQKYAYYFSKKGFNTYSVEYRIFKDADSITPSDEIEDTKSAFRYLRKNAKMLKNDPTRLIGVGMSAGGHLIAASAFIDGYENKTEDLNISSKPNALILQNSVIDLSENGWSFGHNYLGENWREFSPLQHIETCEDIPSMVLSGMADPVAPFSGMKQWHSNYKVQDCVSYLYGFPDRSHGFANFSSNKSGENHRDFYYCIYLIQHFLNENSFTLKSEI